MKNPRPLEPNFGSSASISGPGFYKVPKPWIWRFPNDAECRRDVTCEITTWRGVSIGATHFYANVSEEENAIWAPAELAWHSNAHESGCKSRSFKANLLTRRDAVKFIDQVVETFFTDEKVYRFLNLYGDDTWAALRRHLSKD